jgi:hypothetical protein
LWQLALLQQQQLQQQQGRASRAAALPLQLQRRSSLPSELSGQSMGPAGSCKRLRLRLHLRLHHLLELQEGLSWQQQPPMQQLRA